MKRQIFNTELLEQCTKQLSIQSLQKASIAQVVGFVQSIESKQSEKFIRMELGVPGLLPQQVGCKAEISAIESGVQGIYPPANGTISLRKEASGMILKILSYKFSNLKFNKAKTEELI